MTKALEEDGKHKQAVSQAFGSIAPIYDRWYQSPRGRYVWAVESETVKAMLPPTSQGVVLEIGVGTGMALPILREVSIQLVGIDIAWQMIAVARQKFSEMDSIHLLISEGTNLPFRKKCTDFVLGMTVLEFIPDRDNFLQEINSCLRITGHFLLGVLTSTNFWAIERRLRSFAQHDIFELAKFPTPWQVVRMLYRNGFSQVKYQGAVYAPSFSPTKCLQAFTNLDAKLGSRWLSRALGAFLVFHARKNGTK